MGYALGLQNYHDEKFATESDDPNLDEMEHNKVMVDNDLESLGYRAGFAGLTAQEALAVAKKGIYSAGLNRNFHNMGDRKGVLEEALERLGVTYRGGGKWKLPKGAKIMRAPVGRIEPYWSCGDDWVLRLANGSEWIVWTEDIAPLWCWDKFTT